MCAGTGWKVQLCISARTDPDGGVFGHGLSFKLTGFFVVYIRGLGKAVSRQLEVGNRTAIRERLVMRSWIDPG